MTRICPECGRELTTRQNRFGDETWPRHKMGRYTGLKRQITEHSAEYVPGHNRAALT